MDISDFQTSGALIIGLSDCGEKVTAAGGRVSTQEGTALSIWAKSQDDEKNANLIDKVTRSGHNSVVEHTYFNLAFQNVSAVVEQFIIEFRLASFTVKSRRYVDFSDAGFYVPDFSAPALTKRYKDHMAKQFALYSEFTENGVAKEDARFLLPYCLFSNFFCSGNGREFLHILKAMLYGRGSKYPEIRKLGEMLLEQAKERTPGILRGFEERCQGTNDTPDLSFFDFPQNTVSENAVELLSATPDAAKCVARTALITEAGLSTSDADKLLCDPELVKKTVRAVLDCDRPRALEAVNFSLRYNGVSLSGVTHFTRHRMQGLSVPELTHTDRTRYLIPPVLKDKPELLEKYKAAFEENAAEYEAMKALGVPETDLVYYQLSGNVIDIVSTMNARELLLFLRLRTCTRAQWEIRAHAIEALKLLRKAAPEIFSFYGPSCFVDKCPEGKFSCGRMQEMREVFAPDAL